MSLITSILTGGINNHETTNEEANAISTDFVSEGVVGILANTSGVAPATGGFAVNATGTPDTNIQISTGVAYVTATPSTQGSQTVRVKNSATITQAISANSSGSTKYDWVYLEVDATNANAPNTAGDNVAEITVSRSSSASNDDGTPPTYGILLAVVTVANGFSTITNANIADSRTRSYTDASSSISNIAFDHISSGCVWSGDSYASTRNASCTAGVVYLDGQPHTVTAVSARTFTASKDTYCDLQSNGDGTASWVYSESSNNAASQALTTGNVRGAIIVTGASNIASVGSVNQGQEDKVLPIASSVPYQVTDSLGNLICPRDPQRQLLGARRRTSDFTSSSASDTQVTELSVPISIPTARKVRITISGTALLVVSSGVNGYVSFWDGTVGSGTQLGLMQVVSASANQRLPVSRTIIKTLSAGSHTINAALKSQSGNQTLEAASTSPLELRIELA